MHNGTEKGVEGYPGKRVDDPPKMSTPYSENQRMCYLTWPRELVIANQLTLK